MDNQFVTELPAGGPGWLRLGKNVGGYFGECIEIDLLQEEIQRLAALHGWRGEPLPASDAISLPTLKRSVPNPAKRVYISTGIHGDEPAGPLAVRQLLEENAWPECADIWLCPCLNPTGFPLNKRECACGIDLNRDYRDLRTEEIRAHVRWLKQQPNFDLCLCLHEDWEAHGFYLYELNPSNLPSIAEKIIEGVRAVCPIDPNATIEGREAQNGIIRPRIDPAQRPDWPEAFYLITHKTKLSYTLEAPSDFPLPLRVRALVAGVRAALAAVCADR